MNEEDLRKFIDFTKTLLNKLQGNKKYDWFFDSFNVQIVNSFFQNGNNTNILDKFKSITKYDIDRIKAYLIFIDKRALNYGKVFYQMISDDNLKFELIKDFKEMKIALINDDIIEFGRRLSLQIENIFNFSLKQLDVHNLILNNLPHYRAVQPEWAKKPFDFHRYFFKHDNATNQDEPKELSYVSFKTKSLFLSIEFNFKINVKALDDIYFLRNKGSHRDQLSVQEKQNLERIISDFDKNYSKYYEVLFNIVNGIPNIINDAYKPH
ncbi:MAG: hypothetical protein PWR03_1981 [Tenuifilum sp.]|jgi:hypothetical protein|uniref:hypothetical protein n=1 Tax=Tenuifilum sp. TaxID=2760880 RepID=UPI0024AADA51|nr:hypothetical protein [Tenuifilum sp.]MDI3527798.1 hypothetical protein [Tenuifilum sp.]